MFDPVINEALENDYQKACLIGSLLVKTPEQIIIELLAKEYPELLKHYSDRVGNAVLATIPHKKNEKQYTMNDLYPEKKKPTQGKRVLHFPGFDKPVVV